MFVNENDYDIYYCVSSVILMLMEYVFFNMHFIVRCGKISSITLGIYSDTSLVAPQCFCTIYLSFISSDKEVDIYNRLAKLYVIILYLCFLLLQEHITSFK